MPARDKHLGGRNELVACAWLLREGYEVFRNVSAHGDVDLIATKDSAVHFLDVKTGYRRKDGTLQGPRLRVSQTKRNVKPLYVFDDGSCVIDWSPISIEDTQAERSCEQCSMRYVPAAYRQRFCSTHCRYKFNIAA